MAKKLDGEGENWEFCQCGITFGRVPFMMLFFTGPNLWLFPCWSLLQIESLDKKSQGALNTLSNVTLKGF